MRKLTVAEFISLDGVVESPEKWHMRYVDAEMFAAMYPADSDMDTMLLGRTTYDSFAGAFAGAPGRRPGGGPDEPAREGRRHLDAGHSDLGELRRA